MKHLFLIVVTVASIFLFNSCESCVRKTSQKITELGLTAIEGASDALNEHGEKAGEKVVGAVGSIAKGMGKGLERFINDYEFGEVYGEKNYMVQSTDDINLEDMGKDIEEINYSASLPEATSIEYMGKFSEISGIAAIFIFEKEGEYISTFQFTDAKNQVLLEKSIDVKKEANEGRYTTVAFVFSPSETDLYNQSKKTKVSVAGKYRE